MYLGASRRLLDSVLTLKGQPGAEEAVARTADAMLGVVALESGLDAARRVVVNSPAARADFPPPGESAIDRFYLSVKAVRDDVAHFDTHIARNPSEMLMVDELGVHTWSGFAVDFDRWRECVDALEPWALRHLGQIDATLELASEPDHPGRISTRAPEPDSEPFPLPGVVWCGTGHAEGAEHVINGRSNSFAPGSTIALTGMLVRNPQTAVTMRVREDARVVLEQLSEQGPSEGKLASTSIRGLSPGSYTLSFEDPDGRVLAIGSFTVEPRSCDQ
jgi:hypothetical protein